MNSVAAQRARHQIEYIVIDGASSDGTIDLINTRRGEIEIFLSEPDGGIYDAMNKGLERATGQYIWFLNAGDSLKDELVVERLAEIAVRENYPDILYGETDLVDMAGNYLRPRRLRAPKSLTWKSFRDGMLVCHQSFVAKREISQPYDLQYRVSADIDWCIRCMKRAKRLVNTHLILTNYLEEGVSTIHRKRGLRERYRIQMLHYGAIPTAIRHLWFAVRFVYAKYVIRKL